MSTRSGGPRTAKGKALTRYNAAKHGIYSVTPVLPNVERQADWLKHRAAVFEDLQAQGYIQEIVAERIALNSWRLRRLARYEREQVRNRQRSIGTDLALNAMMEHRKLQPEPLDEDLDLIDRWLMNALIPEEKELMLLSRYEGRLNRQFRLDLALFEHLQRRRADQRRASAWIEREEDAEAAPSLAEPESNVLAIAPAEAPESQPLRAIAERDEPRPATTPAPRESPGDPVALTARN